MRRHTGSQALGPNVLRSSALLVLAVCLAVTGAGILKANMDLVGFFLGAGLLMAAAAAFNAGIISMARVRRGRAGSLL